MVALNAGRREHSVRDDKSDEMIHDDTYLSAGARFLSFSVPKAGGTIGKPNSLKICWGRIGGANTNHVGIPPWRGFPCGYLDILR